MPQNYLQGRKSIAGLIMAVVVLGGLAGYRAVTVSVRQNNMLEENTYPQQHDDKVRKAVIFNEIQGVIKESLKWLKPLFVEETKSIMRDMPGGGDEKRPECKLREYLEKTYYTMKSLAETQTQDDLWRESYQKLISARDIPEDVKNFFKQDCPEAEKAFTKPVQEFSDPRKIKEYAWAVYCKFREGYLPMLKKNK